MSTLIKECLADLTAQGHRDIVTAKSVEMRYLGQNHELEIQTDANSFSAKEVTALLNAFHEQHQARFGFRLNDHIEIVNFIVTGVAKTGHVALPEVVAAERPATPVTRRPVWFAEG